MTEADDTPTELEERLRTALRTRADSIEPSTDGLDHIEEALMTETPTDATGGTAPSRKKAWMVGGGAVAAAVLLVVIGLVVTDDDEDEGVVADTTSTTTTTESTTTTSTTTTPTTEAFPPEVDPYGVAYPGPRTSQRFQSPESAAQSYATEVLGFTELDLGEFLQGDSRSGEIEISDRPEGPTTVVLLRQMEDDTWYVLGSVASEITVEEPEARDSISASFETTGTALAFEGTVDVIVRTQDDPTPIGEGFVTGSGEPPAGPFEGTIELETMPDEEAPGIIVYRTLSAEDGHVIKATSFPVRLSPA